MIENPKTCFFCKYGHIPEPFTKDIPCKNCNKYNKFEEENKFSKGEKANSAK